jgi:hypothetical protein
MVFVVAQSIFSSDPIFVGNMRHGRLRLANSHSLIYKSFTRAVRALSLPSVEKDIVREEDTVRHGLPLDLSPVALANPRVCFLKVSTVYGCRNPCCPNF